MSVRIGDDGGIRIGPETTYGTVTSGYVTQHGRGATLGPRPKLLDIPRLNKSGADDRKFGVGIVDGEVEVAYDGNDSVIGAILSGCGLGSGTTYSIGNGYARDDDSLSVWVDYGGHTLQYLGCVVQSLRIEIAHDAPVVATIGFLGQSVSVVSSTSLVEPSLSGVVWNNDITPVTIGGTSMCVLAATIDVQFPVVGADRVCLGSTAIKQPQVLKDIKITTSLTAELSDDTGADSEAELAELISNLTSTTAAGSVVIGNFILGTSYLVGDAPALGEGITQFPISVESGALFITTS